jgi:hypothetical protein
MSLALLAWKKFPRLSMAAAYSVQPCPSVVTVCFQRRKKALEEAVPPLSLSVFRGEKKALEEAVPSDKSIGGSPMHRELLPSPVLCPTVTPSPPLAISGSRTPAVLRLGLHLPAPIRQMRTRTTWSGSIRSEERWVRGTAARAASSFEWSCRLG